MTSILVRLGCLAGVLLPAWVAAQVNDPPSNVIADATLQTNLVTPVPIGIQIIDPDVGGLNMSLDINVADVNAVELPAAVGRFTWGLGAGVTTDTATAPLATLNNALSSFVFTPAQGFAGRARVVFEIDDLGNQGSGGARSDTDFATIDVCVPAEALDTTACATNNAPVNNKGVTLTTTPGAAIAVPWSVSDVDVGLGNMEAELDMAHHGVAPADTLPDAQVGTFSWGDGLNVTTDIAVQPMALINQNLQSLSFRSAAGFVGQARVQIEIDDQGNSGTDLELARSDTDFTIINVCGIDEAGTPACLVNSAPDVVLPAPLPDALPGTPITFSMSVTDADSGTFPMDATLTVGDPPGTPTAADSGTFSWTFGNNVLTDSVSTSKASLNAALANLTFNPAPGFVGTAVLIVTVDDNGNTGTGGVLSDTVQFAIRVCGSGEHGTAACATNAAPVFTPPAPVPTTTRDVDVAVPMGFVDVDSGGAVVDASIALSDAAGVLAPAQVGSFSWTFGAGVTSDSASVPLASMTPAFGTLVFNPAAAFVGTARFTFTADDNGNTGTGGVQATQRTVDIVVAAQPGNVRFAGGCLRNIGETGLVNVPVERVGGSDGAASVQVSAIADTAAADADFTFAPQTLDWTAGQSGVRNAQLSIAAPAASESTERLFLVLGNPQAVTLAPPDVLAVGLRPVAYAAGVFGDGLELGCTP